MGIINKITKSNVRDILQDEYGLICFASFEDRCLTAPNALSGCRIKNTFVLVNIGENSVIKSQQNAEKIVEIFPKTEIVEINLENPVMVAEQVIGIICKLEVANVKNLLLDISTFTHEVLLIMLRLLYEKDVFASIICLYNGASDYSVGDTIDQVWLSKGCRDVRNVIGYPGILKPSQKNHVILLAGFEVERATRLVELLEPDILSIGDGVEPTESKHEDSMSYFQKKFLAWENTFKNAITNTFTFSCCDIEKTVDLLISIIDQDPHMNYILVPLNTKLSTLAVGLVALGNHNIQVCYAIPETYNYIGYSRPSDNITLVELKNFKLFKKEV